jgi:hypothetical protein
MKARSESVLETLRRGASRGATGNATQADRIRLESAIRDGSGHVVVLGESHHATEALVDSVVGGIEGVDVVHATARMAATPVADRRVLVVVHDAQSCTADELETLRLAWEDGRDALVRVRLILIGSPSLQATLASEGGRALASRVGSTIRLSAGASARHKRRFTRKVVPPSALRAGAGVAAAAFLAFASWSGASAGAAVAVAAASPVSAWVDASTKALVDGAVAFADALDVRSAPPRTTGKPFVFKAPVRRTRSVAETYERGGERVAAWYTVSNAAPSLAGPAVRETEQQR